MESIDNQLESPRVDRNRFSRIWNILTIVALIGVLCLGGLFLMISLNPYSALNPFPPATLLPTVSLPSMTPTEIGALPPSWTPTNTQFSTTTTSPRPSATPFPSATFFSILTPTLTSTSTKPPAGYPYDIQRGSPYAIANLYYPELGCNWMGIGGQVVDLSGGPVTGLIIRLGGSLPEVSLPQPMMSLTGVARNYGESGYEFTLADHPIASRGSLWLQLLDQSGFPLSDKFYFDTFDNCDKNLIIINFKQVR